MRRTQKPIDRNKIKTPRYLPTRPDVLMNSIWLNEVREHRETIEVITPIYSTTPEESPRAMSFDSRFPKASGDFDTAAKANKEMSELLQAVNTDHSFGDHDNFEDYVYSQYYDDNRTAHDNTCYTVIEDRKANNNSMDNQYDEIEVIERKDLPEWNTGYDGNITTFEKDCDDSGRVIWIYSYKKNEDCDVQDYELGRNMPNTSAYLQDIAEEYESGEGGRVVTPVPSEYIPRLDFSKDPLQQLPTVAEISEKSSDSQKSVKQEVMSRKSFNSWFSEFDKIDVKSEANSLEEKYVERTCSSVHKNVETERILMADAETQANDKYTMKPLLKNRSEINTRTIGTQTELIMQCAHAKVLSKPVASNQTFVITDDDNVQDPNADVISKDQTETPKSRTGYEKSKKPIRFHSAPITTKLKHTPYSSQWQDGSIRRIARFRRNVLGNDELCCRKCVSCPDESTPHRSLNDSHSQGSQTCYCIKRPRKLSASVPPFWYDVSPVLDSLRTMHLSLGEDLDYDTMSWWQKLVRCVLCR